MFFHYLCIPSASAMACFKFVELLGLQERISERGQKPNGLQGLKGRVGG